jgi:hypothetical protein
MRKGTIEVEMEIEIGAHLPFLSCLEVEEPNTHNHRPSGGVGRRRRRGGDHHLSLTAVSTYLLDVTYIFLPIIMCSHGSRHGRSRLANRGASRTNSCHKAGVVGNGVIALHPFLRYV